MEWERGTWNVEHGSSPPSWPGRHSGPYRHGSSVTLDANTTLSFFEITQRQTVEGTSVLFINVRTTLEAVGHRQRGERIGERLINLAKRRVGELPQSRVMGERIRGLPGFPGPRDRLGVEVRGGTDDHVRLRVNGRSYLLVASRPSTSFLAPRA